MKKSKHNFALEYFNTKYIETSIYTGYYINSDGTVLSNGMLDIFHDDYITSNMNFKNYKESTQFDNWSVNYIFILGIHVSSIILLHIHVSSLLSMVYVSSILIRTYKNKYIFNHDHNNYIIWIFNLAIPPTSQGIYFIYFGT